jgi:molybdenum cofactor guanylyltransferase
MLGVILCGGESTRMGRDKGLIAFTDETWSASAAKKIAALQIPVVFSINNSQRPQYAAIFPGEHLIMDDPTLTLKGPLAGILSVHLYAPTEDLLVLACDLPLIDPALLKELIVRHRFQIAQSYLYTNDGVPEPLCGIYTAQGLARIAHLYHAGQLARHSMKYALERLTVDTQPIPVDKKQCFQNFNYPFEPPLSL